VRTEDGGQTWDQATVGVPPGRLEAVDFVDARNGWAVGTTPAYYEGGPLIMHTADGGRTWESQDAGFRDGHVHDVAFADALHGWASATVVSWGEQSESLVEFRLLHTDDGGRTWVVQQRSPTLRFGSIAAADASHVWVSRWGPGGSVICSKDGGSSWSAQVTPIDGVGSITELSLVDATHLWAAGIDDGGSWVLRTSTGGEAPDGAPPVTTVRGNDALWHDHAVTLIFDAVDGDASGGSGSGVAYTEYRMDGGAWTRGTQVVIPAPPGVKVTHTIGYRSADLASNLEAEKTCTVRIDTMTPAAPTITRLSPASGRRGALVTITGASLGATRGTGFVQFGGKTCATYISWSATRIKCRVPTRAQYGEVKVAVTNGAGTSNALGFTVKR